MLINFRRARSQIEGDAHYNLLIVSVSTVLCHSRLSRDIRAGRESDETLFVSLKFPRSVLGGDIEES